jgi:hypothetical protein
MHYTNGLRIAALKYHLHETTSQIARPESQLPRCCSARPVTQVLILFPRNFAVCHPKPTGVPHSAAVSREGVFITQPLSQLGQSTFDT